LNSMIRFETLETLVVKGHPEFDSYPFMNQANLMRLPKSLTAIDFTFVNAGECWRQSGPHAAPTQAELPHFDFQLHLPNLRSLHLCQALSRSILEPRVNERTQGGAGLTPKSLSFLPSTLTALRLPNLNIISTSLAHLTALQELEMSGMVVNVAAMKDLCLLPIQSLSVCAITWAKESEVQFPPRLQHLEMALQWSDVPCLDKLPPTLLSLVAPSFIMRDAPELPPLLEKLIIGKVKGPMPKLSRNLKTLRFGLPFSLDAAAVQSYLADLPPDLTSLEIRGDQLRLEQTPTWPKKLRTLSIFFVLASPDHYRLLPPSLTSLTVPRSLSKSLLPDSLTILKTVRTTGHFFRLPDSTRFLPDLSTHTADDGSIHATAASEESRWTTARNATKQGSLEVLKWINEMPEGRNDLRDAAPPSCIKLAAAHGYIHIIEWLLSIGVHWDDGDLPSALLATISSKAGCGVLDFFLQIPSVRRHPSTPTLFHYAVASSDVDAMRILTKHGIVPQKPLLEMAGTHNSSLEVFRYLVEELNEDVNLSSSDFRTPLQSAAKLKSVEFGHYLHSRGAQIDVVSREGHTLAHLAALNISSALPWLKWLDSLGLNLNANSAPPNPKTPLQMAQLLANEAASNFLRQWCERNQGGSCLPS
jgi:hypothetical protein